MQSAPHTSLMVNSETKKTDTSRPNANVTGIINRTKPDRSEARYTVLNSKHPLATITHEAERRTNSASPTTARSLTLPGQGGTDSASAAELAFHHRGRHLTRLLTSSLRATRLLTHRPQGPLRSAPSERKRWGLRAQNAGRYSMQGPQRAYRRRKGGANANCALAYLFGQLQLSTECVRRLGGDAFTQVFFK